MTRENVLTKNHEISKRIVLPVSLSHATLMYCNVPNYARIES